MNHLYLLLSDYARARLAESSTWRNLLLLLGGSWAALHPDLVETLIPLAIAAAGALGSLLPDRLGAGNGEHD